MVIKKATLVTNADYLRLTGKNQWLPASVLHGGGLVGDE
jgi:hypothetical protein